MMEPNELYAKIRKKVLDKILATGEKWIITRNGVPRTPPLTTTSMVQTLQHIEEIKPDILKEIAVVNVLTSERLTAVQALKKYRR